MGRRTSIFFVCLLALAIGGQGFPAAAAPAKPQRIEIKGSEFKYEPKDVTARTGEIILVVTNTGATDHNIVIQDAAGKDLAQIPVISPGKTEELKVTLRPGTYRLVCTLPGHKEAGMVGTLKVQ